jgi:uncharacterized lipoprotein
MQLRFGLPLLLSVIGLTGCSSLAWNNGTLDYKNTASVEPLKYPEGSMVRPASPLYPAPVVDPLALEHAPKFENARGNRYQLARADVNVAASDEIEVTNEIGRPQLLTDGNQNPLLNIQGTSSEVWQYTVATLGSLNHKILSQNAKQYAVTIQIEQSTYVVKLTPVGINNSLAVYNADGSFAEKAIAADLLAQIYQNWPA